MTLQNLITILHYNLPLSQKLQRNMLQITKIRDSYINIALKNEAELGYI